MKSKKETALWISAVLALLLCAPLASQLGKAKSAPIGKGCHGTSITTIKEAILDKHYVGRIVSNKGPSAVIMFGVKKLDPPIPFINGCTWYIAPTLVGDLFYLPEIVRDKLWVGDFSVFIPRIHGMVGKKIYMQATILAFGRVPDDNPKDKSYRGITLSQGVELTVGYF